MCLRGGGNVRGTDEASTGQHSLTPPRGDWEPVDAAPSDTRMSLEYILPRQCFGSSAHSDFPECDGSPRMADRSAGHSDRE
jgi:hypothetical protein